MRQVRELLWCYGALPGTSLVEAEEGWLCFEVKAAWPLSRWDL